MNNLIIHENIILLFHFQDSFPINIKIKYKNKTE